MTKIYAEIDKMAAKSYIAIATVLKIDLLRNSQIDNYLVRYNSLMGLYFRRYYVFVMASRAFCGVAIQKRKFI